jgi:hypothetical protein
MNKELQKILLGEANHNWDDRCLDYWDLYYPLAIHFKENKWFLDYDFETEISETTILSLIKDYKSLGEEPKIYERDEDSTAPYYTIAINDKTLLIPLDETDYEVGKNIWVHDKLCRILAIEPTFGGIMPKNYSIEVIK